MNKKEIRKHIASLKKQYTPQQLLQYSNKVLEQLASNRHFREAKTVLLYHSLPDEVNTHDFIKSLAEKKNVLLPVVVGDVLEIRRYTGDNDLKLGSFNILEPCGEPFTNLEEIDVAVVPGVGFDRENNRLGRGKGYYDKLLCQMPDVYRIGICFPFQFLDKLPCEEHDIKMHEVISGTL